MADIFKGISSGSFLGGDTGFGNVLNAGVTRQELDLAQGAAARDEDRLAMEQDKHGLEMKTKLRDIQIAAQARNEFGEFNRQVLGLLADPDASGLTVEDPYTGETMIDETRGLTQMYTIANKLNMSPEAAAAAFQYIGGLFDLSQKKVEIAGKKYANAFAKSDLDNYKESIRLVDRAGQERRAAKGDKITPEESIAIREQEAFSRGQLAKGGARDFRATPEGQRASLDASVSASRGADWHNVLIDKLSKAGYTPGEISAQMTGQIPSMLQMLGQMTDMLRTTPSENIPTQLYNTITTLATSLKDEIAKMKNPMMDEAVKIIEEGGTPPGATPVQPGAATKAAPESDVSNPATPDYWSYQGSIDLTQVTDNKQREMVFRDQNRMKRVERTYDDYIGVGMTEQEAFAKTVEIYNSKNDPEIKSVLEAMLNAVLARKGQR